MNLIAIIEGAVKYWPAVKAVIEAIDAGLDPLALAQKVRSWTPARECEADQAQDAENQKG